MVNRGANRWLYMPSMVLMIVFIVSLRRPVSTPTFTGIFMLSLALALIARFVEWSFERT